MDNTWTKVLPAFLRTRLTSGHELQSLITNVSWLFIDQGVRFCTSLLVGIWVARYLGPEQFGVLNYVLSFVAFLNIIANLGLNNVVVREIVRSAKATDEILGTTFFLKLLGALAILPIGLGIASFLNPNQPATLVLIAITSVGTFFQAFDTIDLWFQSQVQSKYTVYARNTAYLVAAGLRAALIHFHSPLIAFAWVALLEGALGALGLVIVYHTNKHSLISWRISLARARQLLEQSWPLLLSGLAITVYMKIDQIMLKELGSNQAVGIYAAAIRVSELWYFVPMAIMSSLFPSMVKLKEFSEVLYYRRLQNLFDLMSVLALAVAFPMTFLSKPLIVMLFGASYSESGTVLAIHIWSAIFVFLGVAQTPWDISEGMTKFSLQRTLLGAVMNILLNFVLIPKYYAVGASVATVISYALSAFLANAINRKTRKIFVLQAKSMFFVRHILKLL